MRFAIALILLSHMRPVSAQRMDPDQNPYWTRYTIVEDSSALVPLRGDYQVYYIQSGMWWTLLPLHHPVVPMPDEEVRLRPLFGEGFPAFLATPARGKDHPDVKVVVVRDLDTMVVELSVYYQYRGGEIDQRCETLDCKRRPPMVIPFRPGRYLANGNSFTKEYYLTEDPEYQVDARTVSLTAQFDALWRRAKKEDRIVPQLNTDTCRNELLLPPDLDPAKTPMRDAWVMRSAYCGTHFVHFPSVGTHTEYLITFNPYLPEVKKDPVTIRFTDTDDAMKWMDVTDWPVGDHSVRMVDCGNDATFTLKLR